MHPWVWPGSPHHCPSGCLGMQVQHQTSTHAGNILSSYGNPCKLNPCPIVCYLHVLTKAQGKEAWALPKKLAKAVDDYLAKEGCLQDPFSKKILRNYQPCVSTPNNSWSIQRMCQSTKHCLSQLMPNMFYPATLEENPKNNNDIYCGLFWKTCNGKKCINFSTLDLGWYVIKRHLLEQLLKLHAIK